MTRRTYLASFVLLALPCMTGAAGYAGSPAETGLANDLVRYDVDRSARILQPSRSVHVMDLRVAAGIDTNSLHANLNGIDISGDLKWVVDEPDEEGARLVRLIAHTRAGENTLFIEARLYGAVDVDRFILVDPDKPPQVIMGGVIGKRNLPGNECTAIAAPSPGAANPV